MTKEARPQNAERKAMTQETAQVHTVGETSDESADGPGIVAKVSEATDVVAEASDLVATVVSTAAQDIGSYIRSQREAAQVSMRQLASRAGVSNPYLSQIERGLRKPSAEVLGQIAKGLRVSSEALYVRAGFLEERPHGPVRDALLGDGTLTERQKHVLIEIYESFRRENDQAQESSETSRSTTATASLIQENLND